MPSRRASSWPRGFGFDALRSLLHIVESNANAAVVVLPFATPEVATLMADWLVRLKQVRKVARQWLARHRETAARLLISAALGKPGAERRGAEAALRHLNGLGVDVAALAPTTATDLTAVTDLLDQLLLDGATNASEVLDVAWQRLHRDLTAQRLHWPAAVITDLLAQLAAYRSRSADYEAEQFAALLTEPHARTATGPRAEVLGPDEPAEPAQARPAHRAGRTAAHRVHPRRLLASGDVVLVQRDTSLRTGLRLATSNIVSESATRSASRAATLNTSRVAKTSLTPVGTAWTTSRSPW